MARPQEMKINVQVTGLLTWVERTQQVDADDPAATAMYANAGWHLLVAGTGSGGQPVLLFGWGVPPASSEAKEAWELL